MRALRSSDIDLGLAILETLPVPPGGWSWGDMAAVCNCSPQYLEKVFNRAMKKLKIESVRFGDIRRSRSWYAEGVVTV